MTPSLGWGKGIKWVVMLNPILQEEPGQDMHAAGLFTSSQTDKSIVAGRDAKPILFRLLLFDFDSQAFAQPNLSRISSPK